MTTDGVRPEELGELSPEELYALYMEKQASFGMAGRALDHGRFRPPQALDASPAVAPCYRALCTRSKPFPSGSARRARMMPSPARSSGSLMILPPPRLASSHAAATLAT